MFIRVSTVILSIAAGALAVPAAGAETTSSQCDTGSLQCCESTSPASSVPDLLSTVGILVGDLDPSTSIGLNCNPITAVGTGSGATCTQQTVCCNNVEQRGLVNIGCTPINIGA